MATDSGDNAYSYDAASGLVRFFDASGRRFNESGVWEINRDGQDTMELVMQKSVVGSVLSCLLIATRNRRGDSAGPVELRLSPRAARVLFLEGSLKPNDMRSYRYDAGTDSIFVQECHLSSHTIPLRIERRPSYQIAVVDEQGNVLSGY